MKKQTLQESFDAVNAAFGLFKKALLQAIRNTKIFNETLERLDKLLRETEKKK